MTNEEIIKLGTTLGLHFNRDDNYEDLLAKNNVVFNGINNQRFRFEGNWSNDEILEEMGERKKTMEINRVLSIR